MIPSVNIFSWLPFVCEVFLLYISLSLIIVQVYSFCFTPQINVNLPRDVSVSILSSDFSSIPILFSGLCLFVSHSTQCPHGLFLFSFTFYTLFSASTSLFAMVAVDTAVLVVKSSICATTGLMFSWLLNEFRNFCNQNNIDKLCICCRVIHTEFRS